MTEAGDLFGQPVIQRGAQIVGDCRFRLTRSWGAGPRACIIGHNPSTADGLTDDPTVRWWIKWFQRFGFGGFVVVNLYPWRSADPAEVYFRMNGADAVDWPGHDDFYHTNLTAIVEEAKRADQVFVCWGAIARECNWIDHVVEAIQCNEEPWPDLWCWGKTAAGAPKHPMARGAHRIPADQRPVLWRATR